MQTRRLLLLFAMALLLATAAASLVPVPQSTDQGTATDDAGEATEEAAEPEDDPRRVRFFADAAARDRPPAEEGEREGAGPPDPAGAPATETVPAGERVVVTVAADDPGQVTLEGLGLVQAVGPRTPAVFDLFTDQPGEFDVLYAPVEGPERRLGTLAVVEREAASESG